MPKRYARPHQWRRPPARRRLVFREAAGGAPAGFYRRPVFRARRPKRSAKASTRRGRSSSQRLARFAVKRKVVWRKRPLLTRGKSRALLRRRGGRSTLRRLRARVRQERLWKDLGAGITKPKDCFDSWQFSSAVAKNPGVGVDNLTQNHQTGVLVAPLRHADLTRAFQVAFEDNDITVIPSDARMQYHGGVMEHMMRNNGTSDVEFRSYVLFPRRNTSVGQVHTHSGAVVLDPTTWNQMQMGRRTDAGGPAPNTMNQYWPYRQWPPSDVAGPAGGRYHPYQWEWNPYKDEEFVRLFKIKPFASGLLQPGDSRTLSFRVAGRVMTRFSLGNRDDMAFNAVGTAAIAFFRSLPIVLTLFRGTLTHNATKAAASFAAGCFDPSAEVAFSDFWVDNCVRWKHRVSKLFAGSDNNTGYQYVTAVAPLSGNNAYNQVLPTIADAWGQEQEEAPAAAAGAPA